MLVFLVSLAAFVLVFVVLASLVLLPSPRDLDDIFRFR